jgi:hypothetical protein
MKEVSVEKQRCDQSPYSSFEEVIATESQKFKD